MTDSVSAAASATLVRTTLPPSVRVEAGEGGLPRVAIDNRHGHAEIYFHGAHVAAWAPARAAAPVLWVSRESLFDASKPIRGGIPICFPWFGAHASDSQAPAHGFARVRAWTLIDAQEDRDGSDNGGATTVTFELTPGETSSPFWPHPFRATYRVTIGASLALALRVENTGATPFTFEEALHTYFAVQDVRNVTVSGLERTTYLNKPTAFSREPQGDEPIRFVAETDRIYLNTQSACTIHDPGVRRAIVIGKTGSDTTVVWNPWIDKAKAMPDFGDTEWPEMVCVETCNVNVHARTLAPGESHTMTATIDVRAL
jgi:glucose-6-phosphate 1-epimerase